MLIQKENGNFTGKKGILISKFLPTLTEICIHNTKCVQVIVQLSGASRVLAMRTIMGDGEIVYIRVWNA